MKVHIFIPCFIDQLYPNTGANMVKVLRKAGCEVNYNTNQTCCGQPAFNAGYWEEAKVVGEKFLKDFAGNQIIVCPSGSCVGFVRNYYKQLFAGDAKNLALYEEIRENIYEFSEFLVERLKFTDFGAKLEGKATYHDACGSLRECGIKEAPRQLLENVEGLELIEMGECETCCGFGGTFAVKFEPIAVAMAEQKVESALETEAEYLISSDLSCLMHLDSYIKKHKKSLKIMHLADVLAK